MRLTLVVLLCVTSLLFAAPPKPQPPRPAFGKFTISKTTTFITESVDEAGFIDYRAALHKRQSKGITPDTNANVLIWKALGPQPEGKAVSDDYFKLLGVKPPPEKGEYFQELNHRFVRAVLKIDPAMHKEAIQQEQDVARRRPWTAKEFPHLHTWIKANEKPLALVLEATRRPHYYNPLMPSEAAAGARRMLHPHYPSAQKCRSLSNILTVRVMLHLGEGQTEKAWQDLLACHRLGRMLSRGSTALESLIGKGVDMMAVSSSVAFLQHAKLTPRQIQDCLRDLQQLPPHPPVAEHVDLSERYIYLDTIQMMSRHGVGALDSVPIDEQTQKDNAEINAQLRNVDWDPAMRNVNFWYDRFVTGLRIKNRPAREKELIAASKQIDGLFKSDPDNPVRNPLIMPKNGQEIGMSMVMVMVGMSLPSLAKLRNSQDRAEQIERNLHIAFALTAFQREHGKYPKQLTDLTPKYLATIPNDLFSSKELIYQPSEKGFVLYSVGVDGKDDGGRGIEDDPSSDDLCIRIPIPGPQRKR